MNKIVREHYPAARLPEDLRSGFAEGATVTVSVSDDAVPATSGQPLTDWLMELQDLRTASDDPVARIRALRAGCEWREELHERIRSGDL